MCNYNWNSTKLNRELRQAEQSLIQTLNPMEMGTSMLGLPFCLQASPAVLALRDFLLATPDLQEWYFGNQAEDADQLTLGHPSRKGNPFIKVLAAPSSRQVKY